MIVHLIDGTFELFRYFLSPGAAFDRGSPPELRAVRGVVASMLGMLEGGATHLGVATDHVVESFRNALWSGYKTGEGMDPLLYAQFQPLEEALGALGVVVWPMVEFEADDALAAASALAAADARVEQVVVCTPDKDSRSACAATESSSSIGARARCATSRRCGRNSASRPPRFPTGWRSSGTPRTVTPACPAGARVRRDRARSLPAPRAHSRLATEWDVPVRGATRLATTLTEQRERALLFRELATLRADAPIGDRRGRAFLERTAR